MLNLFSDEFFSELFLLLIDDYSKCLFELQNQYLYFCQILSIF